MNPESGRKRARRLYRVLGMCERCGVVEATERHHRNGDTFDNTPANIARLCNPCHQLVDGRAAAFFAQAQATLPRAVAAARAKKLARTACPSGHPFTPENTYLNREGARVCRTCQRLAQARWRKKH